MLTFADKHDLRVKYQNIDDVLFYRNKLNSKEFDYLIRYYERLNMIKFKRARTKAEFLMAVSLGDNYD
jgi:hypothetical protein